MKAIILNSCYSMFTVFQVQWIARRLCCEQPQYLSTVYEKVPDWASTGEDQLARDHVS